jgi:hypothetical protein
MTIAQKEPKLMPHEHPAFSPNGRVLARKTTPTVFAARHTAASRAAPASSSVNVASGARNRGANVSDLRSSAIGKSLAHSRYVEILPPTFMHRGESTVRRGQRQHRRDGQGVLCRQNQERFGTLSGTCLLI